MSATDRAGSQTQARGGAVAKPTVTKTTSSGSPSVTYHGPNTPGALGPTAVVFNLPIHKFDIPHVTPGRLGSQLSSVLIVRQSNNGPDTGLDVESKLSVDKYQSTLNYGWRAMYNPSTIQVNSAVDSSITAQAADDKSKPMFDGVGTVQFSCLINRIHDVNQHTIAPHPVLGDARDMSTLGTLHDIEWLIQVINGDGFSDPSKFLAHGRQYLSRSADPGYLLRTPITAYLGPLVVVGYITGLQVEHQLFTPKMVPTVSQVSISIQKIPITALDENTPDNPDNTAAAKPSSNTTGSGISFNQFKQGS